MYKISDAARRAALTMTLIVAEYSMSSGLDRGGRAANPACLGDWVPCERPNVKSFGPEPFPGGGLRLGPLLGRQFG